MPESTRCAAGNTRPLLQQTFRPAVLRVLSAHYSSARIALDTRVLGVEDPGTKLMIRAENHLKVI